MKTKIKIFSVILFAIPLVIFFTFNYLNIPKKIFIDTILFFNNYKILSVFLFILFYVVAILLFLPLPEKIPNGIYKLDIEYYYPSKIHIY